MKQSILYILLVCTLLILMSCGKQKELSEANATNNETSSAVESSQQDFLEELAKENYTEITEQAAEALSRVSEASKMIFIDAEGDWMYGYKGEDIVYNEKCCVFTVYTKMDNINDKQGIVAVAKNSKKVFVFDDERSCYVMADLQI